MNRMLQGYLKRLEHAADRIEAASETAQGEIAKLKAEKQELTQKYWARGKKAAVLAETQEGAEALRTENAALKAKLAQAREHAGRLRMLARALKEGVEP